MGKNDYLMKWSKSNNHLKMMRQAQNMHNTSEAEAEAQNMHNTSEAEAQNKLESENHAQKEKNKNEENSLVKVIVEMQKDVKDDKERIKKYKEKIQILKRENNELRRELEEKSDILKCILQKDRECNELSMIMKENNNRFENMTTDEILDSMNNDLF